MYCKMIVSFLVVTLAVASAGIPGGPVDANINDEDVQKALRFAVAHCTKRTTEPFVVAGMNYIFTVKLGRTNCKKGGVETLCAIHKDPKVARVRLTCKITVWSQPWLNFLKVTEKTCI
uniref:Cystatin domain-containing protein n=1 Tax=Sinocyclocheilus rhinocerous TaxID=307959 RepID=A0A673KSL4_9TELE